MRRTTIRTTTATLAALALAGCSLGGDDGPPEAYAHVTEALDSLPDDALVGTVQFSADALHAHVPGQEEARAVRWNAESNAFEPDPEAVAVDGVPLARESWPWETVWGHVAEAHDECPDSLGVRVVPVRAELVAVSTSCSNFEGDDVRSFVGDREAASTEDVLSPDTVEGLLEELRSVVGDGGAEYVVLEQWSGESTVDARIVLSTGELGNWARRGTSVEFTLIDARPAGSTLSEEELDVEPVRAAMEQGRAQLDGEPRQMAFGYLGRGDEPVLRWSTGAEGGLVEVPLRP